MGISNKLKGPPGYVLVGVVILLFIWWGSSKADELYVDVGVSQVTDETTGAIHLQITNRITDHIDLGIGYIGKQDVRGFDVQEQIYAGAEFVVKDPWWGKVRIGIGPYVFQNADRVVTSKFRMGISVEWRIMDRLGLKARHFSNAGSGTELEICRRDGRCFTNDWNTGQDSWARLVWYF